MVSAQYCGSSSPTQCTPSGNVTEPGLSPMSDSLPPFVNGVLSTTVIQFKNFDTVYFGGNPYQIQSLRIDSIENLPQGLCWASDRVNNTYANSEDGCIKVNGTPCGPTGQYKMRIIASATIPPGITIQVDAASVGLHYYARLINSGDPIISVDTTSLVPFIPYGGICQVAIPPSVDLGNDQTICGGGTVMLDPIITGGQIPYSFAWQSIGDTVSCDTCKNPEVLLKQSSTFILTVTDSLSNTGTDTLTYTVSSSPVVTIGPSDSIQICNGQSVQLTSSVDMPVAYVWQLNGTNLGSATDSTYQAVLGGTYRVVVKSNSNCVDTSDGIVVSVITCSGIGGTNENLAFKIYPNPTKDELCVQLSTAIPADFSLKVLNILGQLTEPITWISKDVIHVSTSFLEPGVYLLYYTSEQGNLAVKFHKTQ